MKRPGRRRVSVRVPVVSCRKGARMIHKVAAQLRALWRGMRHRCVRCGLALGAGQQQWCSEECADRWAREHG